jgi:hypothetical protein
LKTFDKPVLGIYIPIVAITLYHYFKNRRQQAAQRLILGYSLAMGLLTIGSYFTTTISMEALLVEAPAGTPAAANAANLMAAPGSSMTSMCTPINTVANIILTLQYLLGDALMVFSIAHSHTSSPQHLLQLYRVYVLYGKQWTIVAAPLVLWTAFLGTPSPSMFSPPIPHPRCAALGIVIPVSCVVRDGMELVPAKAFIPILSTWYLITAIFQISTSGMIVYKLMQHERNMRQTVSQMSGGASAYASLAIMMVESAVLYAAVTFLYIIVWLADSAAQWQSELCYLSASLAVRTLVLVKCV